MNIELDFHQWMIDHALAPRVVEEAWLEQECRLLLKKWPAYRFMTPIAATRLFSDLYSDIFQEWMSGDFGSQVEIRSDLEIGLDALLPFNDLMSIWAARVAADEICMPYSEYINSRFYEVIISQKGKWRGPDHLTLVDSAEQKSWGKKARRHFVYAREDLISTEFPFMVQYQDGKGRDLPARREFVAQLLKEAGETDCIRYFSDLNVFEYAYLEGSDFRPDNEETEIGIDVTTIDQAVGESFLAGLRVRESVASDRVAFFQSCYGLPGILVDTHVVCATCPVKAECQMTRLAVSKLIM